MNEPIIDSKLPGTGLSIFAVMSKMAADHNAINLSQGFPDFNCSDELLDLVSFYQKKGFNQYAPMQGVKSLRDEISKKTEYLYGKKYDPETEITITAGATQALFTAISTIVRKNDEVILLEPAYDSYAPSVIVNGGIPVFIPLTDQEFRIDFEKIRAAINERTRLLIINFPQNPAGSIITGDDIKQLEELVSDKDIFIISDEVYEHIVFDDKKHLSISGSEILSKKSFVISSFGKTFHTTGWKIGYAAAPAEMTKEFRKLHQFITFAVNTPVQHAYSDYLKNQNNYLHVNSFYQKKRDLFLKALEGSEFKFKPSEGTYFQLLDYSSISEINDTEFAELLIKEYGIAVIPLSPFYSIPQKRKLIRICFAKKDEIIIKAAGILKNIKAK
jgi:methionine transaminase